MTVQKLRQLLGLSDGVPDDFFEELLSRGLLRHFKTGEKLVLEDAICQFVPVVISGRIRIYLTGSNGRQITLYYVEPGESCLLSANCLLNGQSFPANAEVSTETTILMIRMHDMRKYLEKHDFWREYIFRQSSRRLLEAVATISEIAFENMDHRLADVLVRRAEQAGSNTFAVTHQEIANELGTAREVVSRLLKDFEARGGLIMDRGSLTLVDRDKLNMKAS